MSALAWPLQDAKARFSEVVEDALNGTPQHVTRRGREAVVVISEADYRALCADAQASTPSFVAHLLAAPRAPEIEPDLASERPRIALRDPEF